jgi:hypothetical protein
MERPGLELAGVRHRLAVLVQIRLLVGLTFQERAEFDRLTDRESELLHLVGAGGVEAGRSPSPPSPD